MRTLARLGLVIGIILAGISVASRSSAQLTYNPVPTTGHDVDIVIESGLADGTAGANGEMGSRQFYQDGLSTQIPTHKVGLLQTQNGFVSPTTTNTINFGFAPFTGNNVIKFDTANQTTKTLTLTTPAAYSNLAMVFTGGSLNSGTTRYYGVLTYTINYVGGGTQTGTIKAADWGTIPAAIEGAETFLNVGRINAGATGGTLWPITPDPETTAGRWRIFVKEVATTNTANILSVDFGNPQQHLETTPLVLDPLATATPTGGTTAVTGADVVVFGLAGATAGGGGFNASDYDHANGVTGADLTILKNNFGTGTTNATGDGEKDGDVDGNDFLLWQRNVGNTSVTAIPEPTTTLLSAIALAIVARKKRRR